MAWDSNTIAKYPRLTDNSDNAVAVRALACRAYGNHYQRAGKWDDLNPMVRNHWCENNSRDTGGTNEGIDTECIALIAEALSNTSKKNVHVADMKYFVLKKILR